MDSECEFNVRPQAPVYPGSPALPTQGCCLRAEATGGRGSSSEENGNPSWLPDSEGAEKSPGEEQARLPRSSATTTKKKKGEKKKKKKEKNNNNTITKAITRIASPCYLQISHILL